VFQLLLKSRQRIGRFEIVRKPVPEPDASSSVGGIPVG